VTGKDAGKGTLVAALAEAAFLIGLERNRLIIILFLEEYLYFYFLSIMDFCCVSSAINWSMIPKI
jgi:hypothetical protein